MTININTIIKLLVLLKIAFIKVKKGSNVESYYMYFVANS